MKKGDQARESVKDTIIEAFKAKDAFVGIQDKKIFVAMPDGPGGEVLQFAITLTMPKVPMAREVTAANADISPLKDESPRVELSPEDRAKVDELMKRLAACT